MKTFLLNIILIFVISCVWSACGGDDHPLEQRLFGNMDRAQRKKIGDKIIKIDYN